MFVLLLWQWTTVKVNYGGNWTALFCTGSLRGVPGSLAPEQIFQFPGSTGYDGQMYHYIAHDPLIRNAELKAFVDTPRLRYRRILVPGLAWIFAMGRTEWVDRAYFAECLLWAGAGVFWACLLCRSLGRPAAWGVAFVLLPAVLVSVDRMVTDVSLATLSVGFVLHRGQASWRLFFILAAVALSRETGFFLIAGYCGWLLLNQCWLLAMRFSLAAAPAIVWYAYVHTHTAPFDYMAGFVPLASFVRAIRHPVFYRPGLSLIMPMHATDLLALAGVFFAWMLALILVVRRNLEPEYLAGCCFALTGIFLQRDDHWIHVYDFGRVYTPLLIFLAVKGIRSNHVVWLVPWAMMLPRLGMQLAPQLIGVIKAAVNV